MYAPVWRRAGATWAPSLHEPICALSWGKSTREPCAWAWLIPAADSMGLVYQRHYRVLCAWLRMITANEGEERQGAAW